MKNDCPDAPWIVEAETVGALSPDPVTCPVCGARGIEEIFKDKDGDVFGCEKCVRRIDAYEWAEREEE